MGTIRSIAADLDRSNRSIVASKIPGSPGTAGDLHQAFNMGHGAPHASSLMSAIMLGGYGGWGLGHPVKGAAVGGASYVVNAIRSAGVHDIQHLVSDALLNPDRAKQYLSKVPKNAAQDKYLSQVVRRSFLAPAVSQGAASPAEPQQRAAGGRVEPTDAQKEAGNYKKSHVRTWGIDITIENKKGTTRSGVGKDGKAWSVKMPAHYGYLRKTVGADGDHVDCYLGPRPTAGDAYIIDQHDPDTGKFDEHKVLIGFASEKDALQTYARGFSDGKGLDRAAKITRIPCPKLLAWAQSDAAKKPTPARRARGGLVGGGGGPFGVPTYEQTLAPAKKAVSRGLGFSTGGTVPDLPEWASPPGAVERALRMIDDRRKAG